MAEILYCRYTFSNFTFQVDVQSIYVLYFFGHIAMEKNALQPDLFIYLHSWVLDTLKTGPKRLAPLGMMLTVTLSLSLGTPLSCPTTVSIYDLNLKGIFKSEAPIWTCLSVTYSFTSSLVIPQIKVKRLYKLRTLALSIILYNKFPFSLSFKPLFVSFLL